MAFTLSVSVPRESTIYPQCRHGADMGPGIHKDAKSQRGRKPRATDSRGNLTRLDNALAGIPGRLERGREQLENLRNQQDAAQVELAKPFPQEAELAEKSARLAELDAALNMEECLSQDGEEVSANEVGEGERPSVLEDLKKRAAEIPPDKKPGKEPERE